MYKYIRHTLSTLASIMLLLCLLISCSQSDKASFKIKPNALGVMNEIVVVSDDDLWESVVGDTVQDYLEGFYPLTPRPEPIFDLRHFNIGEIYARPLRKELRTYVFIANLADTASRTTKLVMADLGEERLQRAKTDTLFNASIGRDKWANGQLIIYLFAHGTDALASAVERNINGISSKVNEHDVVPLSQLTYASGHNKGLSQKMSERYGVEIDMPLDFKVALDTPADHGLYWLRKDTKYGAINIAFRTYKYTDEKMLLKRSAKERFNEYGRYVSTKEANTYIKINDEDLPILEFDRTISNRFSKEWRGIWEMENDFMGGPFISYAIVNEDEGILLVIDAFVFAPGKKKRDLLQQVDLIVKQIKW